jgi:hypothetical protein
MEVSKILYLNVTNNHFTFIDLEPTEDLIQRETTGLGLTNMMFLFSQPWKVDLPMVEELNSQRINVQNLAKKYYRKKNQEMMMD